MSPLNWRVWKMIANVHGISILVVGLTLPPSTVSAKPSSKSKTKVNDPLRNASPTPPPGVLQAFQNPYIVSVFKPGGDIKARTDKQEATAKDVAQVISRLKPVPDDRVHFFNWVDRADSPVVFAGWSVGIDSVRDFHNGQVITIRSGPQVHSKTDAARITVMNMFVEEYLWSNGTLRYLRGKAHPAFGTAPRFSRF